MAWVNAKSSAGQPPGGGPAQPARGTTGPVHRLLGVAQQGFDTALSPLGIHALEPHQLAPSTHHHLAELLEPTLQLTKNLFGVVVGSLLHGGGLVASAADQGFALLLGLLAELERIVVEPFSLRLAVALDPQALLTDRLQFSHRLLPAAFVLLKQLAIALGGLLLKVLASGLGLLLELLAARRELLLQLGHAGLEFLLGLGGLLPTRKDQLLALLAALLAQFHPLAFRLLADRGGCDQILPLPLGLAEDLLGLLAGLFDESIALAEQVIGLGDLGRQGGAQRIHHLDRVLLIHKTTATEGDAAAFENDVLELVQLVENGDARLAHVIGEVMAD